MRRGAITFRVTLEWCCRRCPGPSRRQTHIARHQVAPHEVEEVLYGRPRYLAPGRSGTRLVFGTTTAGRHLLVVIADAPDGGVGIVTARAMTDTEKRAFRRKGS